MANMGRDGLALRRRIAWRGMAVLAASCFLGDARADIQFDCPPQAATLHEEVTGFLRTLGIPLDQLAQAADAGSGMLTLALKTPADDTRTLDLASRPAFSLATESVRLPAAKGRMRAIQTVSRKEIALALLQHGRVTKFRGESCSLEALVDHIGVRQNIVAWAENLNWVWPDGGPARWNPRYWKHGTPNRGVPLHDAVMDVFLHQERYAIGCYAAAKLVVVQGVLDYYRRIRKDPAHVRRIEATLLADGEPLVDVEPGRMWSFEADFDPRELERPGKLLRIQRNVAPGNFIPGDWAYLLNTDAATYRKTGYEGSNALYLGRNRFADFYNDNDHAYTHDQKLNEVYQWRNGVFNRIRDADKIRPLPPAELAKLGKTPATGGLQLDIRVIPLYF